MRNAGLWLAAAGLLASGSGHAADAQVEAGRQCALVRDSLQRLVCYDRIFQAGDPAGSAGAAVPRAAAPVTAPAPARAPVAAPTPVVAAPVAAGGTKLMARSAMAVMVSEGFTPGLAETAEPSIT